MQRFLTSFTLTLGLFVTQQLLPTLPTATRSAQAQTQDDLYYTFYNQRIPLSPRTDQIAVVFTQPEPNTRSLDQPGFIQLQRDLLGLRPTINTRGDHPEPPPALPLEVHPLGNRYAVIQLPVDADADLQAAVQARLQQPYIQSTLPVLSRAGATDTIVLPNEILLSFEPGTPLSQVYLTLSRYQLDLIRPLRFSRDRYLVRAQGNPGLQVLTLANQLQSATGVQAATPNFVQTIAYGGDSQSLLDQQSAAAPHPASQLDQVIAALPPVGNTLYTSAFMPLLWHLNSTAYRGQIQPRTDIRATDAWEISQQGQGVTVAVIDSLIQWDHPDLVQAIAPAPEDATRLPGERHGWDFSNPAIVCTGEDATTCVAGDPDTRLSAEELEILRPHLQNTFTLSDSEFRTAYAGLVSGVRRRVPNLSQRQAIALARYLIQADISAEFHGTWTAGVIAAQPSEFIGAVGVAPQAQILPIRVFGLGGEITSASLVEAIAYAAERKADIINLSLGGLLPDRAVTDQLFAVQDAHPDLVIVASAGNDSLDGVAFPAATPGVVSVGATTLEGRRSPYSTFGAGLDVVAPGGELSLSPNQGILTTGGTGMVAFWQGMTTPSTPWGLALDPLGAYVQVQGTSFAAPAVAGVLALMKGEDPQRHLSRDQLTKILTQTASYEGLQVSTADANQYRLQAAVGFGTAGDFQYLRPTGVFTFPDPVSPETYFFGQGLVNALAAVRTVQAMR